MTARGSYSGPLHRPLNFNSIFSPHLSRRLEILRLARPNRRRWVTSAVTITSCKPADSSKPQKEILGKVGPVPARPHSMHKTYLHIRILLTTKAIFNRSNGNFFDTAPGVLKKWFLKRRAKMTSTSQAHNYHLRRTNQTVKGILFTKYGRSEPSFWLLLLQDSFHHYHPPYTCPPSQHSPKRNMSPIR